MVTQACGILTQDMSVIFCIPGLVGSRIYRSTTHQDTASSVSHGIPQHWSQAEQHHNEMENGQGNSTSGSEPIQGRNN